MTRKTRYTLPCVLALSTLVLGGCAIFQRSAPEQAAVMDAGPAETVARASLNPEWLEPPQVDFTLGPGDLIEIEIVGEPRTRTLTPVGPDGRVYFHVLDGMDVWGLTPAEVAGEVQQALTQFYRDAPRVSVSLREVGSKQVWLLGRLSAPGIYPLTGPTTLLEAIAQAGGPAPTPVFAMLADGGTTTFAGGTDEAADLHRAFLIRRGEVLPVDFARLLRNGDMSQNIYLEPDDLVYLPSAVSQEVHVLGAVRSPRAVPYTRRTSLVAALSAAGGTIDDAYRSQVAIVRGGVADPQVLIVDLDDIVRGRVRDVQLQPNDIVYVPLAPYRILTRYVDLILGTFARTVGINAGARVMSRTEGAGISLPAGGGDGR